jgi:6-phosphogluconolactonase (cycloisomerase 2 family)
MEMKFRALLSSIAVLLSASLIGCGGHYKCGTTFGNATCNSSGSGIGGGGTGTGTTIAASNAAVLTYFLSGNTLDAAGFGGSTFGGLSGYTAPTLPSGFADLMTIVNKQFVYVPMGDTTIQGFSINRSTGALTPIPGSPFQTNGGGTTDGAWSDPKGRFLFVGSEATNSIWAFTIDPKTGALTETAGSPFTAGFVAADVMAVDASGKFLYVGQLSPSAGVAGFSIDQTTGDLTQIPGSPFNLGIAQVRTTPTGEFLMGVQEIQDQGSLATDNHVYVYSINTITGVPTPVSGSPFVTTAAPYDVTISPNGKFLYMPEVSGTTLAPLEGFQINTTTGVLTALSGSPFSSLPVVTLCQFDQAGLAMICAGSGAQMTALSANQTSGALTHAADFTASPFAFAVTN